MQSRIEKLIAQLLILATIATSFAVIPPATAEAAANFNKEINYQGKLTTATNAAVADGTYNMEFKLYTVSSAGSPIWTETDTGTNKVTVTSGLFSVMLGSTTAFTGIDFNQTLYLSVNIGGSGTPTWDGEMTPRKILGAVPAAFQAERLGGLDNSEFLRSDATNATSTATTFLTVTQNGAGKIAEFFSGGNSALAILSSGNIGIGTTTPMSLLAVAGTITANNINATSTATSTFTGGVATNLLNVTSTTASSTFANGISIAKGCFAIGNTCLTQGLTSAITAFGPAGQTQTGPTITEATSTSSFNGLTAGLTIVGSGNTLTYTPSLSGTLTVGGGGTGISSVSAAGILLGNYAGTGYQQLATSSLGLLTTNVAEGTNLYFTNGRAQSATGFQKSGANVILNTSTDFVGIGSSTPWAELSVNTSAGNAAFAIGSSTATQFVVDKNGNVGVGTAAPGANFTVNQASVGAASSRGIVLTGNAIDNVSSGSGFLISLGHNASNNKQVWFGDPDAAGNDSYNFMRFVTGGVGALPTLDGVTGAGTNRSKIMLGVAGDSNSGVYAGQVLGVNGYVAIGSGYYNQSGPSNGLAVQGNVGIGTTSPFTALAVAGTITADAINATTTATSTFAGGIKTNLLNVISTTASSTFGNGIVLTNGCILQNGSCLASGLSAALTSIGPAGQTTTGPAVTLASSSNTTNGLTSNITITGSGATLTFAPSVTGTLTSAGGGTGISSVSAAGILLGNYAGTGYQQLATSSLGLLTTNVAEGSNLYFTNGRVDTEANLYINASSTIPKTYTANTFTALQTLSAGLTVSGNTTLSSVAINSLLSTNGSGVVVATSTPTFGQFFATSSSATSTIAGGLTVAGITGLNVLQNGNIGVGTTSPQTKLYVENDANALTSLDVSNGISGTAARSNLAINASGGGDLTIDAFSGAYSSSGTDDAAAGGRLLSTGTGGFAFRASNAAASVRFYTGSAERMRVDNSGNIGIGTTTPMSLLAVAGTITANNINATSTATSTFTGGVATNLLNVTSTTASSTFANGISIAKGCFAIGNTCLTQGLTSAITAFGPLGQTQTGPTITEATSTSSFNGLTSALTIIGSGNTLTYTPTLSGTLTVGGGGTGLGSATAAGILLGNYAGTGFQQLSTSTLGLLTTNVAEGTNLYFTNGRAQTATGFQKSGANVTLNTSTDFVGIGSSTPWAELSVNTSAGNAAFAVGSSTGTQFVVDKNGNVGIGTSSPSEKLTVNGRIALTGGTSEDPATLANTPVSFLGVTDPVIELGLNVQGGTVRTAGVPAVWMGLEGNYANNGLQAGQRNYSEWYVSAVDAAGKSVRPLAFTWDNGAVDNYMQGSLYMSPNGAFNMLKTSDGSQLFHFGGDGIMQVGAQIQFPNANPVIQTGVNTPIAIITNGNYTWASNNVEGFEFGSGRDTNLYRSAANTLKTDDSLLVAGNVGVGTTSPYATLAVQASGVQANPLFEVASTSNATKFLSVSGTGFGTTTVSGLNINGSATTTSNVGFSITSGCFAIGTTCVGTGASGLTSIGPTGQTTAGPAVTLASSSNTTNGLTSNITITGSGATLTFAPSVTGTLTSAGGGTGISSVTAAGILLGNYAGTGWQQLSTSTLGLLTTNVAEGSNLYYTNGRVDTEAGIFINASTTIPKAYTTNTFSALNTYNGGITIGSLNGPLDARNGVIGATTSIGVLYGGTGQTAYATGDILYSNTTNSLAKLGIGTGGFVLGVSNGVPAWVATTTLATISGTLTVAKGGTNASSFSPNSIITSNAAGDTLIATGTQLTVGNLNATTTATSTFGGAITVSAGQGTSTFAGGLSTTRLNVTSGTSTFANGLVLTSGCLIQNGSCLTQGLASAITAFGPAGQTQTGPTITEATSTSSFNGLTAGLTIVGSGNTVTYTPTLSGTLTNAGLANSTISGVALGGTLGALTAANTSLTFSGSYTGAAAQTVGLNLGNSNIWTVLQSFNYSSSTIYSSFTTASTTNLVINGSSFNNLLGSGLSLSSGALTIGSGAITNAMLAGSIDLTTKVTGTLPFGNGGTGATSFSPNSIITSNAAGTALIATGTQLTVGNLNATTTATSTFGGAITVSAGQGTSTFAGGLSTNLLNVISTTASSTFANGINLTKGCFAVNNSCVGSGAATLSIGSAITGGTQGSVLFVNSSNQLAQDNANFFWDNTTKNLGIGSSTPFSNLSIAATAGESSFSVGSSSGTYFMIDKNGKVGIGTTTPAADLYVLDPTVITDGSVRDMFVLESQANTVTPGSGNAIAFKNVWTGTNEYTMARITATDETGYGGTLQFQVRGTSGTPGTTTVAAMTIRANGSVGIGTTNPGSKLDVAGFINTDQYSGFRQAGSMVLYSSSTNGAVDVGNGAGPSGAINSTLTGNTAVGSFALAQATLSGGDNTGVGWHTLVNNLTGFGNSAIGSGALYSNISGAYNVAIGQNALQFNTSGIGNMAMGLNALALNTTGTSNMAVGGNALNYNITGNNNSVMGNSAMFNNTSATNTTAVGYQAAQGTGNYYNQGGTYIGYLSGFSAATSSDYNTFLGYQSGFNVTTGADNILIGGSPNNLNNLTTGSQNIAIGYDISLPSVSGTGQLDIGNFIYGKGFLGTGSTVSSASLGLGTTSPFYTLTVASTTASQFALSAGAGVAQWAFRNAGGNLYFSTTTIAGTATTSTSAFSIDGTTGTVSIGNGTSGTLHLGDGDFTKAAGSTWTFGGGINTNGIASVLSIAYGYAGSAGVISPDGGSKDLAIYTNSNRSSELALYLTSGLVGIGTTTPKAALNIASTTGAQLLLSGSATDIPWSFRSIGGNFYLSTSSLTTFATSSTPTISIVPGGISGLLGFGSSSPWGKVSIEMAVANPAFVVSNQGSTTPAFMVGGVNQNGVVSIGSSTPSSNFAFDVAGNSFFSGSFTNWGGIYMTNGAVGTPGLAFASSTNTGIYSTGAGIMNFSAAGTQKLTISATGALVATTTGSYALTSFVNNAPQLALSSGAGFSQWTLRAVSGNFYLASTTAAGTATTSSAAMVINGANGFISFGTSTTPNLGPLAMSSGAFVTAGGAWTNASDRNLKDNFTSLDPQEILAKVNELPVTEWNYKSEDSSIKHIGPIAQDFYSIFDIGNNNTSISTIDPAGIALIGLQAISEDTSFSWATASISDLITASSSVPTTTPWVATFADASQSLKDGLTSLGDVVVHVVKDVQYVATGIYGKIFAKEVHTDKLCVEDVCVTKAEFLKMTQAAGVAGSGGGSSPVYTPTPTPTPPPSGGTTGDTGSGAGDSSSTPPVADSGSASSIPDAPATPPPADSGTGSSTPSTP